MSTEREPPLPSLRTGTPETGQAGEPLSTPYGVNESVELVIDLLAATKLVPGVVLLVRHGQAARKMGVPFGPFLALGSAIALFAGPWLLHGYWALSHH